MDTLRKLILANCLAAVCLFGQQRQTVFTTLATGLTTLTTPATYLISNNIGQSVHTFAVTLSGSGTCSSGTFPYTFSAQIETSFDNSSWNSISPSPQVNVSYDTLNNTTTKIYRTSGAFPYIRLDVTNLGSLPSNCSVTLNYTGTLGAIPVSNIYSLSWIVPQLVNTSTCTALFTVASITGSQVLLALTGLTITPITGTGTTVNIFSNSTCTNQVVTANALNIIPTPANSRLATASVSNNAIGYYFTLTGTGSSIVTAYIAIVN